MSDAEWDVIVVGAGNAAGCAALAAKDAGAEKVVMLERAPEDEAGGNTRFTAGAMRVVYDGVEDIQKLVELSDQEIEDTDFGTYTKDQFFDDIFRVTEYRTDPDAVAELLPEGIPPGIDTDRYLPRLGRENQTTYDPLFPGRVW